MSEAQSNSTDTTPGSPWSGSQVLDFITAHAGIAVFAYSPKLKSLLAWSPNLDAVLGTRDMGFVRDANLFLRYAHPDDRFQLMNELEAALRGDKPYRTTYRWLRPDDRRLSWLHCRAALVEREDGPLFEGAIIDLSSELTGASGKLAGPDSIATILAAFPTMVFTLDRDLRLLRINRSSPSETFNFGDQNFRAEAFQVGSQLLEGFSSPEQRAQYELLLHQIVEGKLGHHRGRVFINESVFSLEILPLGPAANIEGLLCIISDISEVVRSERQLAELRKKEGLRLLASGLAHNFNNALQSIVGHAAAIGNHPENLRLIQDSSRAILDIVNRTSHLAHQFLADESVKADLLMPIDMNLSVMAAVNRIDNLFSSGVKVAVAFGNPPEVMAREEELINAIEAILLNAREALNTAGTIAIKTFQVQLDNLEVEDLRAGLYAKLTISDSGSGMEAGVVSKAFDPFFTTKEIDPSVGLALKGRGLGLSRAFSVIRAMGGAISIESKPGNGTTVSIYLPVSKRAGDSVSIADEPISGTPEILVVDDDVMVLKTMRAMLRDFGYECLIAEDYRKALSLVKSRRADLRIVLLDAVMPGMDGIALMRKIRRINRELKVIGFSGAPTEYTKPMLEAGAIKVLRKPVDPKSLKEELDRILNEKKAA